MGGNIRIRNKIEKLKFCRSRLSDLTETILKKYEYSRKEEGGGDKKNKWRKIMQSYIQVATPLSILFRYLNFI